MLQSRAVYTYTPFCNAAAAFGLWRVFTPPSVENDQVHPSYYYFSWGLDGFLRIEYLKIGLSNDVIHRLTLSGLRSGKKCRQEIVEKCGVTSEVR
jgi:hypothetical protein